MSQPFPACVLCTSKRRDAEVGLLCRHHLQRLASLLWDVEDQAALLDTRLSMQVRSGRGSRLASHRAPLNLDALVALDPRRGTGRIGADDADPWGLDDTASILDTFQSWTRIVREERDLSPDWTVSISGEREVLSKHLDWCAAQPWIDDMYDDVRRLAAQLHRTNRTSPDEPAGECYLITDAGTCGGKIWRTEQQHYAWARLPDRCARTPVTIPDGAAYCDRCGQTWDGEAVARLNLALEQQRREDARPRTEDGRPMKTAHEIAADLGVTVNTVRIRLTRAGAKSVGGHFDEEVLQPVAS